MDYHSIHGHDISSFGTQATHRLPTVSASQVLDELKEYPAVFISTGIECIDFALRGSGSEDSQDFLRHGGIRRGQVTEVWGPPGTGKTALGVQLAANALRDGNGVVWVDCFQQLATHRLVNFLKADENKVGDEGSDPLLPDNGKKFTHYSCLTLPHFMALMSRPTPTSIATDVTLIVVDAISALLNSSLPRSSDAKKERAAKAGPTLSDKRKQALQYTINALQKLAATRNCAVVLLSQCATKMQSESGATLVPAVNATVWDQGISTRLVLFKDWAWHNQKPISVCLAGIQKYDGKATGDAVEHVSAFRVAGNALVGVPYDVTKSSVQISTATHRKRKLGQAEFEVPDSDDDEDYGWADEDEAAVPAQPPQWQGSEDILLGQDLEHGSDEDIESGAERDDQSGDELST